MQELVGKTLDNYEIREKIGQGGMAEVYLAFQPGLERLVAVKVLSPSLASDPDFTRRFRREARAIASFNHPHIVDVYDFGVQDGYYYLVMRYVQDSRTLATLMEEGAPVHQLLDYVIEIAGALDYAHRRQVLHRDVKPGNILIDDSGALLTDFGLVRIGESASDLTSSGLSLGTPAYMSPEQAVGDEVDHRTDIYSLGAVVFQILTGQIPHEATTPHGIIIKRNIQPAPSLLEINPDLPPSLDRVVRRALAKDPEERFSSAGEFAKALEQAQQDLFPDEPGETTVADMAAELWGGGTDRRRLTGLPAHAETRVERKRRWPLLLGAAVVIVALAAVLFSQVVGKDSNAGNEPTSSPAATAVADLIETEPSLVAADTGVPTLPVETPPEPTAAPTSTPPALPPGEGMVRIPQGRYRVGLEAAGTTYAPPQTVEITTFWIDVHEVSNAEYVAFLEATEAPAPASWEGGAIPQGLEDHPVEGVRYEQALAYCEWANKRLPTEAEWEVVARGAVGLLYPWGNNADAVELPSSGTFPVASIQGNRSPFGAYDMAGNVWEWVSDPYAPLPEGQRVLRGGAHGFLKDMAYRLHGEPDVPTMFSTAGFRCAADRVGGN